MSDTSKTPPAAPDTSSAPPAAPVTSAPRQRTLTAQSKATKTTYYKVLHGAVGQWGQDTVISSDDLAGIDVGRLLKLGAIAVTSAPDEDAPADE